MRHLLYQALATEFGIAVETDDPERLRATLYKERRESGDDALACLTLTPSRKNPSSELWIIRRAKEEPNPS